MSFKPQWSYLGHGAVAVVAGVGAAVFGHDLIKGNNEAANVIVTVFSILAGFLVAVMSLLGDQSVLPGTWRIAETSRKGIRAKLTRQKYLFYLYLLTLSLIFVSTLLRQMWPIVTAWTERCYFGLATTAFVLSFGLPRTLMDVQLDRMNAVIEARRQASSKLDRS